MCASESIVSEVSGLFDGALHACVRACVLCACNGTSRGAASGCCWVGLCVICRPAGGWGGGG